MIYSKNSDELVNTFENEFVLKYPKFEYYLQKLYERKEQWALCFEKVL